MAEAAISRLAAELEAGRSEALTNVLAALSRFRRYSWQNVLLITAQRPNATQVAGIHAWNDLGRSIKKSEKGLVIFAPVGRNQEPARRQGLPRGNPFRQSGARAAFVFDVSQTDGKPLPEFAQANVDVWKYGEQLRALVAKRGIDLQVDRSIEPARGTPSGGKIRISPGLSPVEWVSVLTHELAHEMLHHRPEAAALSRDAAEAQAYGVAYVVACGLSMKTDTAAAKFMAQCSNDKKAIAQTLSVIQATSGQILDELLPEERITIGNIPSAHQVRPLLDAEDFGHLHRDYRDRLIHSITGLVRDRDKAEDIAAQAFEKAWEKREGFRGGSRPSTWLESIARNETRQSWSRERIVPFDSMDRSDFREVAALGLVTDELEKQDDRYRLQKALEQLPVKYRRALVSHFVNGLSTREIARRERVPFGTVLSRIHTGKQLLRHAWEASITGPQANGMAQRTPSPRPQDRQPPLAPESSECRQPSNGPPEPVTLDR